MSFMGGLLSGTSPLYGRAGLDLVVQGLGYRAAAEFRNIGDPRLAVLTHSVVGGTPAYHREFVDDDAPDALGDFDDWVCRTVLNPARPLYGEAEFLLAAEPMYAPAPSTTRSSPRSPPETTRAAASRAESAARPQTSPSR
ncbi:hypothetical protein ACWEQ7_03560 [Streptomyces sp. NPDC004069]